MRPSPGRACRAAAGCRRAGAHRTASPLLPCKERKLRDLLLGLVHGERHPLASQRSLDEPVEHVGVVETAPTIAVVAAEDNDLDPITPADLARASFPRPRLERPTQA